MKRNGIKYIIFIVIIGFIFGMAFLFYTNSSKKHENTIAETEKKEEITMLKDMRLGIAEYDTMNPIISKNKNIQSIAKLIFEPLLTLTEDYKIENCLAKEWSKTGDNTYVLKLQEGIVWQDGTEFTASDVKFTIEQIQQVDSIYTPQVADITSVEVVDVMTIKLTLSKEIPFFEYQLTFPILSQKNWEGEDFMTSTKIPMGTGMYKIADITAGNIYLEKNQNYWQKEEKNSKIESIAIHRYEKVGELYNDFKLGNIDFIHTDSDILEDYIGTLGYHKKEYKGRALDFLAINCQNQALSQKEVRQAIQYGIDKTGIINTIFQNKYESSNFPLDFGQYLYTEEKESVYDTAKVKQVLEENGWTLQSKVWQKRENRTTLRLSFTLTVLETNEKRVQVAEAIRDSLEPLGIKLTVRKVSEKEYQNILEKKNYELLLTGIYSSFSPDLTYFLGEENLAGYRNETALQLLQEINDITEQNLLQQKIQELANIYLEDVPYICLYRNKETTAYNQKLAGNVAGNSYNIFYVTYIIIQNRNLFINICDFI